MLWSSAIYGGFVAVALGVGLTTLALYPIMRQRFLLWFTLRAVCLAIMAFMLLPMAMPLPLGEAESPARWVIANMANAFSAACAGPFLANLIEPRLRVPILRRRLHVVFAIGVCMALIIPMGLAFPWIRIVYHVLLALIICIVVYGLASAIRAGSRLARYQALAWAALMVIGLISVTNQVLTGTRLPWVMGAALIAMIFEFSVTAMGIVEGFMNIKQERDEAVAGMKAATLENATDPLTGIANRRGLERQFAQADRGRPTAVAIFDCDEFKSINDTYGHGTGDSVLMAISQGLRAEDDLFVARLGGEEFVVLLYTAGWQRRAERARLRVEQAVRDRMPDFERRVTASAGVTEVLADETLNEALRRADSALYAAKRDGRNQTYAVADRALTDHLAFKVA